MSSLNAHSLQCDKNKFDSVKQRRFLFFGFIADQDTLNKAFACETAPQVSAVKFQSGLIEGFVANGVKLEIVSALPIASYPSNNTVIVKKHHYTLNQESVAGVLMKNLNLPIIKLGIRLITSVIEGRRSITKFKEFDGIFVYSLHSPFILSAFILRKFYNLPIFIFIPDLPMNMWGHELTGFHRIAKKIDNRFLKALVSKSDVIFPISKNIAHYWLNDQIKSYVVEGISPKAALRPLKVLPRLEIPKILYAGTFSYILKFANAFASLTDLKATLIFMGDGPDAQALRQIAGRDTRILLKPFAQGAAFEAELENADFLLNPRDTSWEGGNYSFPSKLFDYMARGRPILSTRLKGIPDEYFDCFFEIDDTSPEKLRQTLQSALMASPEKISQKIRIGENMLATTKSSKAVVAEILEATAQC